MNPFDYNATHTPLRREPRCGWEQLRYVWKSDGKEVDSKVMARIAEAQNMIKEGQRRLIDAMLPIGG